MTGGALPLWTRLIQTIGPIDHRRDDRKDLTVIPDAIGYLESVAERMKIAAGADSLSMGIKQAGHRTERRVGLHVQLAFIHRHRGIGEDGSDGVGGSFPLASIRPSSPLAAPAVRAIHADPSAVNAIRNSRARTYRNVFIPAYRDQFGKAWSWPFGLIAAGLP
jgi:hypothetical protein